MSVLELLPMPVIVMPLLTDLEPWMAVQTLPETPEQPIWKPSGARPNLTIRGVEHLAVLMGDLSRRGEGFASIEWPRPFPHPWAQTRPGGDGLIVELNDGVIPEGRDFPCTRRAFRGERGEYPYPNESDPRYQTTRYPVKKIETFRSLEGAELIWIWITTTVLPPGVSLTMRHFGAKERQHFRCGDQ